MDLASAQYGLGVDNLVVAGVYGLWPFWSVADIVVLVPQIMRKGLKRGMNHN